MKKSVERRNLPFELSKQKHDVYISIDKNTDSLKRIAVNEQKITIARYITYKLL